MSSLYRHLKAVLNWPARFVHRTAIFSRALLGLLLFPGAWVLHGGGFALFKRWRSGRGAFTEVLDVDQALLREYLISHGRLMQKLVTTGLALAIRVKREGSVKRSIARVFKLWRSGGLASVRQGVAMTTPGLSTSSLQVLTVELDHVTDQDQDHVRRVLLAIDQLPPATDQGKASSLIRDFCALGYEVVILPGKLTTASKDALAWQDEGVTVVTRQSLFDNARRYLNEHSPRFGLFVFTNVDLARAMLPTAHRLAPHARTLCQVPAWPALQALLKGPRSRHDDDTLFLLSRVDHLIATDKNEQSMSHELLPNAAVSVLEADSIQSAVRRASLLNVLDAARALPIALFHEVCQTNNVTQVSQPAQADAVDVSIIIPVYNQWQLTHACLTSVVITSADSGVSYEVILADDGSTDETAQSAAAITGLRVVRPDTNLGFLRNCNHAARQARGRHIMLLNNDTIVMPGWLQALYSTIENDSSIAIVGSKLLYPDGTIQEAGGGLLSNGDGVSVGRWFETREPHARMRRYEPALNIRRETDYISGASMLVRKSFWDDVGGFDERYEPAYCEDSDLAMMARATGWRVVYEPASEAIHFEHQTYSEDLSEVRTKLIQDNKARLVAKWKYELERDHLPPGSKWFHVMANGERSISSAMKKRRRSGKLNVLYFSPFPSHPASHGNQSTIQQFARRFQALGHTVHFVLLQSGMYSADDEQAMHQAWDTLDILPNSLRLASDGQPIAFDGWYEEGLGETIRMLCSRYDIDVLFCSYVFQSRMLEYVPDYILKVIDTHDKMGDRYEMLRAHGRELEFFSCTPDEEGAYLRRADLVVARRAEEAQYFNSVTGRDSAIVIPHVEEPRFIERNFNTLQNVGTVASANQINLAIVRECLEAIDRQLDGKPCPFTVHVAGQVKGMADELPAHERAVFERPWVKMLGFVPDIADFYADMDVVLSPVTMGTGINVKTVQAMAFGLPLLTTVCGSKGIETEDPMHVHEDLDSLAQSLLALAHQPDKLNRLARLSRERYQQFYEDSMHGMTTMFTHSKLRV